MSRSSKGAKEISKKKKKHVLVSDSSDDDQSEDEDPNKEGDSEEARAGIKKGAALEKYSDKVIGKANVEKWDKKGKPLIPEMRPVKSSVDSPTQVTKQMLAINNEAQRFIEQLPERAAIASNGTAPGLDPHIKFRMTEDAVMSSVYPEATYNAVYTTGAMGELIERQQALSSLGSKINRVSEKLSDEQWEEKMLNVSIPHGYTLDLPEWNPLMHPPDGTMVAYGRRRTGKSWLFRELLFRYRYFYRCVIVLTNTRQNNWWAEYVPFAFIHQYDPFVIARIIAHQKSVLAQNWLNSADPRSQVNPYLAVVLDDVVSSNMHHDPLLNQLFYEGRHSKLCIFISTQHPKALPPGVRANADTAVFFPQQSTANVETIWEQYCNFFEDQGDFALLLAEYTLGHSCIVMSLSDTTVPLLRSIYKYQSQDPGPFKLCSRESWKDNYKNMLEYYQGMAKQLQNNEASGAQTDTGGPPGFHWLASQDDGIGDVLGGLFGSTVF